MESIQEPSWHDQSWEEEYKVVKDFSFYCVIDGSMATYMIHDNSDSSTEDMEDIWCSDVMKTRGQGWC